MRTIATTLVAALAASVLAVLAASATTRSPQPSGDALRARVTAYAVSLRRSAIRRNTCTTARPSPSAR